MTVDTVELARARQRTDDLPLFTPNVETPAPSAAASSTSELAADAVSGPFRRMSWRRIIAALAADGALISRESLSDRLGIPQHILCARLSELVPLWVECVDGACASKAKPTLKVNGYRLTDACRRRVAASRR